MASTKQSITYKPGWDLVPVDISSIKGNAHSEVKKLLAQPYGWGTKDTGEVFPMDVSANV
jgi:hypothetical protein